MTVPATQPPPPPDGPRVAQDRLREPPRQTLPVAPSPPKLPPGPPDTGKRPIPHFYMGDAEEQRPEVQSGLGKPPDFPGSGASTATRIQRESFRNTQPGPGKVNWRNPEDVVQVISSGGPPPAPGAGGVLIPARATPGEPLGQEVAPHQGPDPSSGPAFLEPRVRPSPYGPSRTRINGKTPPSLKDEFFAAPPEQMDTAASAPAAIVPMEEQNTGVKRSKEAAAPKSKAKAKKKKDEIVATQSPPSLPPPPPGGAAALRATEEPDVEPASASSANAPTSVPHYRQKEGSAPSGSRKKPPPGGGEMIDDLPAVPVKRKGEKPLEEGIPDVLRPERQRPRAPLAEPDSEPNPLQASSSSSSSSSSRRLANRNPMRV